MVAFGEILNFDPEQIQEIFTACNARQQTCTTLDGHVKKLSDLEGWQGDAADAAKKSAGRARVDLDAHGNEVWKVAAAARDCYNEAVELKASATRVQADADAKGFVIDSVSGTVTDPDPPVMRGWADADKATYYAEIDEVQARVNDIITAAERFDDDLAAAINAADGSIPLTPKGEGTNVNLADRRANQVAAYRKTYGKDPTTTNDWRMAAVLDPHSYDPKSKGVNANIVTVPIKPVPGQGVVRTNQFIKQRDVVDPSMDNAAGRNKGDNRDFQQDFDPENSRVAAYIDYERGLVVFRQNPSVVQQADGSSGHVEAGEPHVSVQQADDGAVRMRFDAADPIGAGGPSRSAGWSVNGDMTFTPTAQGAQIGGTRTDFPWFEAYQSFPDGREATLSLDNPQGFGTGSSYGPLINLQGHHDIGAGGAALSDPKWIPDIVTPDGRVLRPGELYFPQQPKEPPA
ncbi:hypothetical protein [Williamsia sp. M5A3_1d]